MADQLNLKNEELSYSNEFKLVYSGPTFESGIKIKVLIDNLKSIEELIYNIADVNYEYNCGNNNSNDIQEIKVIPKKGSIEEEIIIFFSKPEVRDIVIAIVISLFFYLLNKKDSKESEKKIIDRIDDLILSNQLKNVKKLCAPLEQEKDKLQIIENNNVKFEVNFIQKDEINNQIKAIDKQIKTEETVSEYKGYISAVDIDSRKLRFHPEEMDSSYPLKFDLPITTVAPLIGKSIKAKMNVRKYNEKIRMFELLDYNIIQQDLSKFIREK